MKVALISDTHNVLREEVIRILEGCDEIWHCGDFCSEQIYHQIEKIRPLYAVRGNNDKDPFFDSIPEILTLNRNGISFVLCHYRSKLEKTEADVKCFGHSHQLFHEEHWLNPGSCGRRRFSLPLTMMILQISDHVEVQEILFPGK